MIRVFENGIIMVRFKDNDLRLGMIVESKDEKLQIGQVIRYDVSITRNKHFTERTDLPIYKKSADGLRVAFYGKNTAEVLRANNGDSSYEEGFISDDFSDYDYESAWLDDLWGETPKQSLLIKELENYGKSKDYQASVDDGTSVFSQMKILDDYKTKNGFDTSKNNGGSTDYYKFDANWKECQDIIEARNMNFSQGNIFKASFCFNQGRHNATTYERELNKIKYFCDRELERIKDA